MKETERAYLAGIVDGEGHIAISKRKPNKLSGEVSPGYLCYVKIGSTDYLLVDWIKRTVGGGSIYETLPKKGQDKKPFFTWHITSKQAENFLREIYPYLVIKRRQADFVFELRSTVKISSGRIATSEKVLAYREKCFSDLAAHHRRRAVLQSSLDMP